jgi:hypothetical protein
MAELVSETFTVWRQIGQLGLQPVLEAAPVSEPGARVTIWPGTRPELPATVHPLVAMPLGRGELNEAQVWIEDRPPGALLSDLEGPLCTQEAAQLMAQVADALGALHTRGHAHGQVQPNRVIVTLDGTPVLIGAGVQEGTVEQDLKSAVAMLHGLCGSEHTPAHGSAAALAAALREMAMSATSSSNQLREQVECAMLPPPANPQRLSIVMTPLEYLDEVQPDLGPDERVRGLLDRWSSTGSNEDLTDDRTETISASELAAQGRRVMLDRLSELYRRPTLQGRFAALEGTPCEPLKALIADEALDPLPPPDGVLRRGALIPDPEPTVEVTQEAPQPALSHSEEGTVETSGWTEGERTFPRSPAVRALTIALIAALSTLAVFAALAAYLTYGTL